MKSAPHWAVAKRSEIVSTPPPPDLVISDLAMPGIRGPELLEAVKQVAPSTAKMLMSGYALSGEMLRGVAFLQKPFTPDKLIAAVQAVLAESARVSEELRRRGRCDNAAEGLRDSRSGEVDEP
jgi:DNA-binding NtrC family response regulator